MTKQPVAVFDLDYTMLDGDSENTWVQFMYEHGLVDSAFVQRIAEFYADYEKGNLDGVPYEEFLLRPNVDNPPEKMFALRDEYLQVIRSLIRPQMVARLNQHRQWQHALLLISASNSFVVEPIAAMLGFTNVISTPVEIKDGKFTGKLAGVPALEENKAHKLKSWLEKNRLGLAGSWGYGDSRNDLPILSLVEHAVAVTPDPVLRRHAVEHNWEIVD
jgi:HAD superfamily hydrolase (TIGR01490 family)